MYSSRKLQWYYVFSLLFKCVPSHHRKFLLPACMAFETLSGDVLAVGFKSGEVRILRTDTLQDLLTFKHSGDAVASLKFSPSGTYLAGYDESHCTLLFKRCYVSTPTLHYPDDITSTIM